MFGKLPEEYRAQGRLAVMFQDSTLLPHLTVRENDHGARALYTGLGFEEERVVRPLRKGFTLA